MKWGVDKWGEATWGDAGPHTAASIWDSPGDTWDLPGALWDEGGTPTPQHAGRPAYSIQIAFGDSPWETNPTWIDVTKYVLQSPGVTISRGQTGENRQPTPGSANFTLVDFDRRYDPLNQASPYVGKLTPNCPCRIVATYNSTNYPLFYGYVDSFPQTYAVADNYTAVPILALDALSVLARTSWRPVHPFQADVSLVDNGAVTADPIPDLDIEKSGWRVDRALTQAGVPDQFTSLDAGASLVEGGIPDDLKLLDHFAKVVGTENGRMYANVTGRVTFKGRNQSYPSSAAAFQDNPNFPQYSALELDPADRKSLRNRCVRSSHTVPDVMIQDDASIAAYGEFEDSQQYLFAERDDALAQCQYIVDRYAQPTARINKMTVLPDRNPDVLYPIVLAAEQGVQYDVTRTPLKLGDPIVKTVVVEKIDMNFSPVFMSASFEFSEADPVKTFSYFYADVRDHDKVDSGNVLHY